MVMLGTPAGHGRAAIAYPTAPLQRRKRNLARACACAAVVLALWCLWPSHGGGPAADVDAADGAAAAPAQAASTGSDASGDTHLSPREARIRRRLGVSNPRYGKSPTLAVVCTCNMLNATLAMLDSMAAARDDFDLAVYDDHSVDGTVAALRALDLRVWSADQPVSLTGLWNRAYVDFRRQPPGHAHVNLLLLNNDLLVPSGAIDAVSDALRDYPFTAVMSHRLGVGHQPLQAVESIYRDAINTSTLAMINDEARYQATQDWVASLSAQRFPPTSRRPGDGSPKGGHVMPLHPPKFNGFAFAYRAPEVHAVAFSPNALVDPSLRMTDHETDLGIRMRAAGVPTVVCTRAFMYHHKSLTTRLSGYVSGMPSELDPRNDLSYYHPELRAKQQQQRQEQQGPSTAAAAGGVADGVPEANAKQWHGHKAWGLRGGGGGGGGGG